MLTKKEEQELLELQQSEENYWRFNKIKLFFGDSEYTSPDGQIVYPREKYPKFLDFFSSGKRYKQRGLIAANRVGKSNTGITELVYHVTGEYPEWWDGFRFDRPITAYIAGDRGDTVRDALQEILIGSGTIDAKQSEGLLPGDKILNTSQFPGIPGLIGTYWVKHKKGTSIIKIKTYQAGRDAFEGFKADYVMLDEEVPRDIFSECVTRTMTTKGLVVVTFTPDKGLTDTYLYFADPNNQSFVKTINVTWDDVPHLSEEDKKRLLASYSPQERDCRSKGIPYLGKGKIYNIVEDKFLTEPVKINRWWPRMFGMDVGYSHPTACIWCAWDRESDVVYVYSTYKQSEVQPGVHASAILARGSWIPGVVDTSANRQSETDQRRLSDIYRKFGIDLYFAKKGKGSVEEGILEVYDRLDSGRLKIFSNLTDIIDEIRLYRRDDKSQIVKKNDDLLDALRYAITYGLGLGIIEPNEDKDKQQVFTSIGKSEVGGY